MNYDEFTGQVQHYAKLPSRGDAVRAIRATLEALSQRLAGGEADDLADQLPMEIQPYLRQGGYGEQFDLNEFYRRVSVYEEIDLPIAVYHARVVIAMLVKAVSPGEIKDAMAQLPDEFRTLFEYQLEGEARAA